MTTASRRFYLPFVTKTAVLAILLLITIGLIALTEIACRQIPKHAGIGVFGDAAKSILARSLNETGLLPRQNGKSQLRDPLHYLSHDASLIISITDRVQILHLRHPRTRSRPP